MFSKYRNSKQYSIMQPCIELDEKNKHLGEKKIEIGSHVTLI